MKYLIFILFLFNTSAFSQGIVTSEVKPIVTVYPLYPKEAVLARIEGYVNLQFTVGTDGAVKDVHVISSLPEKIFNQAAVQAILKYKFAPQMIGNVAIEQIVTQKINFKLSEELSNKPSLLETFARNVPTKTPFMAVYDLKIDKNKDILTEVLVVDSKEEIDNKLLVWQNNKEKIPNFLSIQDRIINQAKSDFIKSHGAFNQYQKLCLSKTCSPILLSKLNSLPYKGFVDFIKLTVSMNIDRDGNVVNFKVKKIPRKYKHSPLIKQMLSQLKFLPATKNNMPIASKITATMKAFATSQKNNFFLWGKERIYLMKKIPNPWVRVALLINKKGNVLEAKAIDSSDIKFEKAAVKGLMKYKFSKNKTTYQLIKLVEFKQPN